MREESQSRRTARRILVPLDFSALAEDVLEYALTLAAALGAEVLLCHVGVMPDYELPELVSPGMRAAATAMLDQAGTLFAAARAELEALKTRKQRSDVVIHTSFMEGRPAEGILRCAQEWGADLIVMGSHKRRGLAHALVGSIAEQVIRRAECPVLIVHPKTAANS